MENLLEILKIIEGGLKGDRTTVAAYTGQLADKLEKAGEKKAAARVRRATSSPTLQSLEPAKLAEQRRLPVDAESRLSLAHEEFPALDETLVFLDPDTEESTQEFLRYIRNASQLLEHGVPFSPTLLLHGPPGCGKTQSARFIAASLQLPLLTARLDSMVSSFLGSTAKNIRNLFDHAQSRPCVLFLDEFDAIAKLRDDQHEQGELKRVVVSLLQNIDLLDSGTILLAATNHSHLLDPAVWRRFAYKLEIGLPSSQIRARMFSYFLGGLVDPKQVPVLASASEALSGSMLRESCDGAARDAVLDGQSGVSTTNLLRRILTCQGIATSPNGNSDECIRKARAVSPKAFTYKRLSEIYGRSTGYISNLLTKEG